MTRSMNPMKKLLMPVVLAALALSTGVALGSPAGDLDPSFGGDGKLILPDLYAAHEVLVQEDGKIVVVGYAGAPSDFVVARLNADGSPDATWGDDGKAVADFGDKELASAAAIQPDGKVVVAGSSGLRTAVARFDSSGKLDSTFDPGGPDGDGKKLLPNATLDDPVAVLVQPDGRIVLAGQGSGYSLAATRLTPTGALDETVWERGTFDGQSPPFAGALTPDGKIVVAGTHYPATSPSEIALARFDSDGKLDKTLGGTGKVTFGSEGDEQVRAVLVQPDGKIVVAGHTTRPPGGSQSELVVTRFDPDGRPDASWDGDARAFADFEGQSGGTAAALQPDGKVVVAAIDVGDLNMAAARFNPDGTLDATFGSGGRTTIADDIQVPRAVALQRDGRVILAGEGEGGAPVARLQADPAPAGGGDTGAPAAGPGVDRDAPVIGRVTLAPVSFSVARGHAAVAAARGTTVRYSLSEPGTVTFRVERAAKGRRVGGRCKRQTRRNRGRRRCVRYVPLKGSFKHQGRAGPNRFRFTGRLRGRKLRRGRYRLRARAIDAAGNHSPTARKRFRIVRH